MKKITTMLLVLLLMSGVSYGAVSDDIYVRRDVYEAHMQGMNTKLDMLLEQMRAQREEMNGIREEVKAQAKELKNEMNGIREEMKAHVKESQEEHKAIRNDIAELTRVMSVMSERINRNFDTLSARIEGLDKRMDSQQNYLYLVLVILGIIVALPTVQKMLQGWQERKEARRTFTTLDDVRRLIEENNARMAGKIQA